VKTYLYAVRPAVLVALAVMFAVSAQSGDRRYPVFVDCPENTFADHCDTLRLQVRAEDPARDHPNSRNVRYHLISGPGQIDERTGVWTWSWDGEDSGMHFLVEIAASIGDSPEHMTPPEEYCRFSVTVNEQQPGIQAMEFDCGDSIAIPDEFPSSFRLRAYGPDCDPLDLHVGDVSPPFAGTIDIGGNGRRRRLPFYEWQTHVLQITPDSADFGETFHMTVEGASNLEQYNCDLTFTVEPMQPYRVRIDGLRNVAQGQYAHLDVILEEANVPLRSFDFKVVYDASVIAAIRATPGDFLTECGWENLGYSFGPFEPRVPGEPSGQMRVRGSADGAYGTAPTCFLPENLPATLFTIDFFVTDDRTYECTAIPVRFYWHDCRDNLMRPPVTNFTFLSNDVYDLDGSLLPRIDTLPFYFGAPDECLSDSARLQTRRLIDFQNGYLDIICADSIDDRGDININGVAYEVADVVLFTNYFVYGAAVFTTDFVRQAEASDVNGDGLALTVEDLQWMIQVIDGNVGWSDPYDTTSPNEAIFRQAGDGSVEVLTPDTLGATWFEFEGYVEPIVAASGMEMGWAYDGTAKTRVLVYSLEGHGFTAGPVITNAAAPLLEVQTCTYKGAKVEAIIDQALDAGERSNENLPERFAVGQNYPNPFNSSTVIRFDLPRASDVSFTVYNILGKVVHQESHSFPAGRHRLLWDGRSLSGGDVASGVYFYGIEAGDFSETKKMLLLK